MAVDQSAHVQRVGNACCGQTVVRRWGKTQNLNITQQLIAGIRYFDFRVAVHPQTNEFRLVHGLYGGLVSHALRDINTFLMDNPREIVILDFNHFYNMSSSDHQKLLSEILTRFGHVIPPRPFSPGSYGLWNMTLQNLWSSPYRVIPIYHHALVDVFPNVWPREFIESPWCNTSNVNSLINFLDNNYKNRHRQHNDTFYNWQGILSPSAKDIALHPASTLESHMAAKATPAMVNWLQSGTVPGPREINICTADFVEKYDFIPTVIELNKRISYFPPSV